MVSMGNDIECARIYQRRVFLVEADDPNRIKR